MTAPQKRPVARRDRLIREWIHDTYRLKSHWAEPTACPDCGAVYHDGRWSWREPREAAAEQLCPACLRVRDRCPAGWVHLRGEFLDAHELELMHLIHHVHERERSEHPLNRIMDIERKRGELVVTTTNQHLARAIGEALHDAHEGELDYHYNLESPDLVVHWSR